MTQAFSASEDHPAIAEAKRVLEVEAAAIRGVIAHLDGPELCQNQVLHPIRLERIEHHRFRKRQGAPNGKDLPTGVVVERVLLWRYKDRVGCGDRRGVLCSGKERSIGRPRKTRR